MVENLVQALHETVDGVTAAVANQLVNEADQIASPSPTRLEQAFQFQAAAVRLALEALLERLFWSV